MKLIELKNASKYYLDKTFNLTINKHELLLITGTNGSGKTTLIKLILAFIGQIGARLSTVKILNLTIFQKNSSS